MAAGLDTLHVSFITLSELYYGVYKSQKVQENLDGIKALEGKIKRVDSDQQICETFGKLKATAARYAQGTNVVVLGPDVVLIFPTAAAVNEALRTLGEDNQENTKTKNKTKEFWSSIWHSTKGKVIKMLADRLHDQYPQGYSKAIRPFLSPLAEIIP